MPEVLNLALHSEREGWMTGVYIETKDPTFHARMGLPLEERLVQALMNAGYKETIDVPVILQSFEEPVLPTRPPCTHPPWLLHCMGPHPLSLLAESLV